MTDVDSDNDGVADCLDNCPADPLKQQPGACGCGHKDTDSDGDGIADCNEVAPLCMYINAPLRMDGVYLCLIFLY